ncbi:MAG: NAD(P)H-hydrate dehydratase [Synergistaceae bacterium]|nr:NAD(P)H-hydrate dehydratase [Synergistaceae bacterium]
MESFYHSSDVREADRIAERRFGIPSVVLMENAARGAADAAEGLAGCVGSCLVLAGGGNNGGDGFAAARHLLLRGWNVTVVKTHSDEDYKGDAALNLAILRALAGERLAVAESGGLDDSVLKKYICEAAVVIDALLGTGTKGAPRGEAARLISLTEGAENVLSLDIPSGIDPDGGGLYSPSVRASATVTFLAPKRGMAFSPALESCGRRIAADIGAPAEALLPEEPALVLYEKEDIRALLPPLSRDIHKTERGGLLICAGSEVYRGAPLLTALGALRAGAGLVFLAVPDFIAANVSAALPEAIVLPLATRNGAIDAEAASALISSWLPRCGAAVIGPGMGRGAEAGELFLRFWKNCRIPLLIDADMLYFFAERLSELPERNDVLLTPHGGEAARILRTSAAAVNSARADSAERLKERAGFALLKGRNTLIASDGPLRMIGAGSPALAVPGSGDVLSGVIGALMASGIPIADAATAGALAHGAAGEALEDKKGLRGALAREIADEIPSFLG